MAPMDSETLCWITPADEKRKRFSRIVIDDRVSKPPLDLSERGHG